MVLTKEIIDTFIKRPTGRGYVETLSAIFHIYNFSLDERIATERFLFEPTKEKALQLLRTTPKSCIILLNYLDEDTIAEGIAYAIEEGYNCNSLVKMLYIVKELNGIVEKIAKMELKKFKKAVMELRLSGNKLHPIEEAFGIHRALR